MLENYLNRLNLNNVGIELYFNRIVTAILLLLFFSLCLSKAVVNICLGVLVIVSMRYHKPLREFFSFYKPLVVSIFCYSLVVFLSDVRYDVAVAAISTVKVGFSLIIALIIAWLLKEFDVRKRCVIAFATSFCILAIIVLGEKLMMASGRPSLMGNPVGTAYKLSFGIVTGLFVLEGPKKIQIYRYILLSLCMAAILVLETRAALIGTFAVVLYYIYLKFNVIKRNKTALLIIASAVVAAALFCNFYGQRLLGIVSELQTVGKGDLVTTSTGQRLYMWIKSFEMFTNNIVLGVGYSGWQSEFKAIAESENLSASFPRFNQPHNFIVDIASTTGVAGLITFMMFLFSPLYCLVRSRISAVVNNLHIGNIYVSLLIMFICLGLFDSIARMHAPFMIFVMLLAILLSYGDKSRSGDKNVA